MKGSYFVELKRDRVNDAWVVTQRWPQGTTEGRYFYDDNKQDRRYHEYFKECCMCAPKDYELGDIVIDDQRQMFAEYKPKAEKFTKSC